MEAAVETANKSKGMVSFPVANNPLACLDRGRGLAKRKRLLYVQLMAFTQDDKRSATVGQFAIRPIFSSMLHSPQYICPNSEH